VKSTIVGLDEAALRDVVRPVAPVASVYLGLRAPGGTVDLRRDLRLREETLAQRLVEQGAGRPTVDAIIAYLGGQRVSPTELALFAAEGELLLAQEMAGSFDLAYHRTPAHLLPLLSWLQGRPPYVVVVTDRTGADLTRYARGAVEGRTTVVEGPDDEIERNAPGGWSQPRYQRRAEDSWQHNAARVAQAAVDALGQVGARLLIVAGDVRAVQLFCDHLPSGAKRDVTVRQVNGGRSPDGSEPSRRAAIERIVAGYAEEQTAALLERFAEALPPSGYAVEGAQATLRALADSRVATLIVAPRPNDDRVAWFGAEPTELGASTPPGAQNGDLRIGPLADVAVRAALLTDADVRIVDGGAARRPAEGIGALCRYR